MKVLKLRTSFTVFILFFGISLLEAFRTRNWINVAFWIIIGTMFLVADNLKEDKTEQKEMNNEQAS
jgi:hypothetical protein